MLAIQQMVPLFTKICYMSIEPVGRDSYLDTALSILENRSTRIIIQLGFTVFISKRLLLKSGTAIVVDRDLLFTVQPNLRANHHGSERISVNLWILFYASRFTLHVWDPYQSTIDRHDGAADPFPYLLHAGQTQSYLDRQSLR